MELDNNLPSESTNSYCKLCIEMFATRKGVRALHSPDGYRHGSSSQIQHNSQMGCPLCSTIYRQSYEISQWKPETYMSCFAMRDWDNSRDHRKVHLGSIGGINGIMFHIPPIDYGSRDMYAKLYTSEHDPAAKEISGRPLPTDLASERVVQEATTMFDTCQTEHRPCNGNQDIIPLLPARVIDVDSNETDVRLHISKPGERDDYVALSYCWGGPQPVFTTLETLDEKIQGIKLKDLPKTLQDAIQITRKLDFRYLWVDALCIIQDSDTDKGEQISQMGDVYMGASLTIRAAGADSVLKGFLSAQDLPNKHVFSYSLGQTFGSVSLVFKYLQQDTDPLDHRAWAFQEAVLSPRSLIFARHELLWSCQVLRRQQLFDSPFSYSEKARLPSRVFAVKPKRRLIKGHDKLWTVLVEEYTSRALTFPEDRLRGIEGIAQASQKVSGDIYLYGLWHSSLIQHLAWYLDSDQREKEKSTRAPSWSWASINQPIKFRFFDELIAHVVTSPDIKSMDKADAYMLCIEAPFCFSNYLSLVQYAHWDTDFTEIPTEKLQLITLGHDKKELALNPYVGLILEELDNQIFRRVGQWMSITEIGSGRGTFQII